MRCLPTRKASSGPSLCRGGSELAIHPGCLCVVTTAFPLPGCCCCIRVARLLRATSLNGIALYRCFSFWRSQCRPFTSCPTHPPCLSCCLSYPSARHVRQMHLGLPMYVQRNLSGTPLTRVAYRKGSSSSVAAASTPAAGNTPSSSAAPATPAEGAAATGVNTGSVGGTAMAGAGTSATGSKGSRKWRGNEAQSPATQDSPLRVLL